MYITVIVLMHFSSPWVQKIAPSLRALVLCLGVSLNLKQIGSGV